MTYVRKVWAKPEYYSADYICSLCRDRGSPVKKRSGVLEAGQRSDLHQQQRIQILHMELRQAGSTEIMALIF